MKLKKIISTSLAAVTIFSAGNALLQASQSQPNIVEAATKKSKKLTHNAAIYNSKGKRVGKKTLKKGKKVKILGTKKIKGNKYYRIGKNKYVKASNFIKKVKFSYPKLDGTGFIAVAKRNTILIGTNDEVEFDDVDKGDAIVIPGSPKNKDTGSYHLFPKSVAGSWDIITTASDYTTEPLTPEAKGYLDTLEKFYKGYDSGTRMFAAKDTTPLSPKAKTFKAGEQLGDFEYSTLGRIKGTWYFGTEFGGVKAADVKLGQKK